MTSDEWGSENRTYPKTSGHPGKRDPSLTPYMIPFSRAIDARTHKKVVMAMFAQGGKSETLLDVMGQRFDTDPVPMLYVGPTKQYIATQWEPRITALLEEAPALKRKAASGKKMTKTKKVIAGVPLRLAHGGSSTALKSDPAGLCFTDEADELLANVKGQGDPIRLTDRRGDTYPDFVHAVVSTPSEGTSEVEVDPQSGLEFWAEIDLAEISSTIWRLWQSGTRYHWAWPCPHCETYFIPRFSCLQWDKPIGPDGKPGRSTPMLAARTAHIVCRSCGGVITDDDKEGMNAAGLYVAPGQEIVDGKVVGNPPDSWTISYWVSGLASPFKSWGERAAEYVEAAATGDPAEIQAVINGGLGELYAPGGGEVPEWSKIAELACPEYRSGEVPAGVRLATLTVDVQGDRLPYTVRGWGASGTSWLIEAGEIFGDTSDKDVWQTLEEFMHGDFDGVPIKLALIDAGFRPGKKTEVPVHRVYEFCARNKRLAKPTRGSSTAMVRPIATSNIEVNLEGKQRPGSVTLLRLDTDHFKRWVHERLTWDPEQPGGWHLPVDVSEDYCRQMVSEVRIRKPSGKPTWVKRSKDNHYFDCEAMQAAAGSLLNVLKLRDGPPIRQASQQQETSSEEERKRSRGGSWLGGTGSIWK